jgi:hypothetical protein
LGRALDAIAARLAGAALPKPHVNALALYPEIDSRQPEGIKIGKSLEDRPR